MSLDVRKSSVVLPQDHWPTAPLTEEGEHIYSVNMDLNTNNGRVCGLVKKGGRNVCQSVSEIRQSRESLRKKESTSPGVVI